MATASPRVTSRLILLATSLLVVMLPGTARAGTYDVWSCKTPSGTPTSTAGWTGSSSLLYDLPGDDCALGGRLTAKFSATGGAVSGGLFSRWRFDAPAGTTVESVELDRSTVARAADGDERALARAAIFRGTTGDDPKDILEGCDSAEGGCTEAAATDGLVKLKVGAPSFGFSAGCAGEAGASLCRQGEGSRARLAVDAAKITLADAAPPVAKVSGRILGGKPVRGKSEIRLTASDEGSGVWQAEVRIGAKIVMPRRTIDANGGRCATLPGTKAFGDPVPCKAEVEATLDFDAKGATDGSQLLNVTVWDAANNPIVAVSEPVSVDNAKRINADGTIMMPAIDDPLDTQLWGGGGKAAAADGLRPMSEGGDPLLARIVSGMNTLADARIAYCYGGGHGTTPAVPSAGSYCWQGNPARKVTNSGAVGLDCSSSLSWVIQQAGFDIPTMTSGSFAGLAEPGEGEKMTIWANGAHVYAEVKIDGKSYYWGTASANPEHGPGWHAPRSSAPFTARHLPGL